MMNISYLLLFISCGFLITLPKVSAFPTGAGGCSQGVAVASTHLINQPLVESTLEDAGLVVTIDDATLDSDTTLEPGTSYNIEVTSPDSSVEFRGFLIRLEYIDGGGDFTLEPVAGNGIVAAVCFGGAQGITHFDPSPKTTANAVFTSSDVAGTVRIDVNIVFYNNGVEGSFYALQENTVTVAAAPPPTDAPITAAPTNTPTDAPVVAPTDAPVADPTSPPTIAPTIAPVTDAPVDDPTTSATSPPEDTDEPTSSPTESPTVVLVTAAPTPATTQMPTEGDAEPPTVLPVGTATPTVPTPVTPAPVAATGSPVVATAEPVAPTEPPVVGTAEPVAPTEPPVTTTASPTTSPGGTASPTTTPGSSLICEEGKCTFTRIDTDGFALNPYTKVPTMYPTPIYVCSDPDDVGCVLQEESDELEGEAGGDDDALFFDGDSFGPFNDTTIAPWTDPVNQDKLSETVAITRDYRDGIFNALDPENLYDKYSGPSGTEWALLPSGMTFDEARCQLQFGSWNDNFAMYNPEESIGKAGVVHLIEEDVYYNIMFTQWTSDDNYPLGGGFQYIRDEVPFSTADLPECPICSDATTNPKQISGPIDNQFVMVEVEGITPENATVTILTVGQDSDPKCNYLSGGTASTVRPNARDINGTSVILRRTQSLGPETPFWYTIYFTAETEGGTCRGETRICVPVPGYTCDDFLYGYDATVSSVCLS